MNPNIDADPSRRWPELFLRCHAPGEVAHYPALAYGQIHHQVLDGLYLEMLVHRHALTGVSID
jgi:hypothetical protein